MIHNRVINAHGCFRDPHEAVKKTASENSVEFIIAQQNKAVLMVLSHVSAVAKAFEENIKFALSVAVPNTVP